MRINSRQHLNERAFIDQSALTCHPHEKLSRRIAEIGEMLGVWSKDYAACTSGNTGWLGIFSSFFSLNSVGEDGGNGGCGVCVTLCTELSQHRHLD